MTELCSTFKSVSTASAHTLNDLGGSTATPVALQSSVSVSSLPQQVTQLLTGLQLVLLLEDRSALKQMITSPMQMFCRLKKFLLEQEAYWLLQNCTTAYWVGWCVG